MLEKAQVSDFTSLSKEHDVFHFGTERVFGLLAALDFPNTGLATRKFSNEGRAALRGMVELNLKLAAVTFYEYCLHMTKAI